MQAHLQEKVWLGVLLCLALVSTTANAQNLGSIVGLVTDSTGAVVPSATVKVTQQETGVSRTVASDTTGTYLAPTLNAGTYTVEASASGFKTFRQTDIVLNVRDQLRVDVRLEVGQVAETIEVVGETVSLQTETATVEQVVSGTQVQSLMMNGRSFLQLPALIPGASSTQPAFNTPVGVTANAGINFNGLRSSHNVWRVDGQENYDRGCGGCVEILPSVDAIAEFKVSTANSDADMGFGAAGQINLSIKSGTRDFHGTIYEFLRNDKLDANQFFRNINGSPKAKLRFNNFGYNLGGPVVLPGYNKDRNKTFFFWNQEWRKLRSEAVYFQPAIPAAYRTGNFSAATQIIRDPTTELDPATNLYQPFPNNTIPAARIDPNATLLADPNFVFPLPNAEGNRWAGVGGQPINVREEILRVDHNVNERNQIFFRFVHDTTQQQFPTTQWGGQTYPTIGTLFTNQPKAYHGQWTSTFTPNIVNEASLSFSRQPLQLNPSGNFQRPAGLNIPELYEGNNANRIPNIRLQGVTGVTIDTGSWPWTNNLDTWIVRDSLIWNRGKHTLRMGGEFMPLAKRQDLFGLTNGDFYFNNDVVGHDFANFLLGRSFEYRELERQTSPTYMARSGSLNINDSWRASPRLTINLGLRYDMLPHAFEKDDLLAAFYPGLYNPARAPTVLSDGQLVGDYDPLNGIAQAGKDGIPRGIVQNYWNTFLPRIGVAWRPWGESTVVRFGYGIYTERIQGNDVYNVGPNPPNSFTAQIFGAPLSNPGGGAQRRFPSNLQTYDGPYKLPKIHQYNFGIQQRLTSGVVASASYVGTSAAHLQTGRNINQPTPEGAARVLAGQAIVNQVRPFVGWGNINSYENSTGSSYNSLQFSLRTENYRGLTLQASYTWSHALDYVSGDVPGTSHQDSYNTKLERANSNFDRRQMLILSYVYEIPTPRDWGRAARHALGGWTFSGISSFQSGIPLNITLPGDNAGIGGGPYRPDVIRDPNLPSAQRIRERYFDPTAFAQPERGRFGSAARNIVRQGGLNNWDLSVFKNIPLGWESGQLQFRGEFFNAFNHTQWSGYRNGFGTADFGYANAARDARSIQFGLKFLF
ncbi:MAG: carboxypeptidase regulatory-like domain-containing protein [Bryobacteraceae bacterium]|nr:carboxypeptidase regulatory-like domain-containing protein [Bryobacteraceae bacterium]